MGRCDRIEAEDLSCLLGQDRQPVIIDVRRREAYGAASEVLPTAEWRDHRQMADAPWPVGAPIVVYCAHGEQVSQSAAALLRAGGADARYLKGGIAAWQAAGGPTVGKAAVASLSRRPSRWVTRERPKIDRIACPWLIRRFLDRTAQVFFVTPEMVLEIAAEIDGIPFDIPGVEISHDGELCSFDVLIRRFAIADPVLHRLAVIVRGADTARLDLAPQCAGLLAVSLGLSATCDDDQQMLARGMLVYDALYGWLRLASSETHTWSPPA